MKVLSRFIIVLLFCPPMTVVAASSCEEPKKTTDFPKIALQQIVTGLKQPVHIAHAGEAGRLYIVEQDGHVQVADRGQLDDKPYMDISDRVVSGGEKGLLSIAFHPDYKTNGQVYVDYTAGNEGLFTRISRFNTVDQGEKGEQDMRRVDRDSEEILMVIEQPFANHNGGQIVFGPDRFLYIGMGDGGWANDPWGNGQKLFTLLGALLRIDVDHPSDTERYAIPADNPFVGQNEVRPEIWAYGMRNPWRFSFDRDSGLLYLADVGQDAVEEINVVRKGKNYGWNVMEGDICTPGVNAKCKRDNLASPIFTYRHPEGSSITGGHVYRGKAIPGLCGVYLYADYVTRKIWGLRYDGQRVTQHGLLLETPYNISTFGEDSDGELYIAAHRSGIILKIVAADAAEDGVQTRP